MSTQPISMTVEQIAKGRDNPFLVAAEANHRVANHLGLLCGIIRLRAKELRERADVIDAASMREILDDLCVRVDSIAHLHRILMLAEAGGRVSLFQLVGEVCTKISSLFPPGRVFLSMNCEADADVGGDRAVQVGRIVAEMVTNAVKYAHPTGLPVRVDVGCRQANENFVIEVSDDGVGLPENFKADKDGGLGFRLMRSSAGALGGRLEFEHECTGLHCRLIFPISDAPADNVIVFKTPQVS